MMASTLSLCAHTDIRAGLRFFQATYFKAETSDPQGKWRVLLQRPENVLEALPLTLCGPPNKKWKGSKQDAKLAGSKLIHADQ